METPRRSWLAQLGLVALLAGGSGSGIGLMTGTLSKAEAQQLAQNEARAEVGRSARIQAIEGELDHQAEADRELEHQLACIEADVKAIDRNLRALMNYQRGRDRRSPAPIAAEHPTPEPTP
jgi:phage-related minor tail protein